MLSSTLEFFNTTEYAPVPFREFEISNLKRDSLTLYETVQEYFATLAFESEQG